MDLVLHRNDLRLRDNRAVSEASEFVPLYIFDQEWLENELISDHRVEFIMEALKDLNSRYNDNGSHLVLRHGDTLEVLEELEDEYERILFLRDRNHFRQKQEEELRERYTDIAGSPATMDIQRPQFRSEIEKYVSSKPHQPSKPVRPSIESNTSISEIRESYSIDSKKEKFGEGGRTEAIKRLENFADRIDSYAGCISSPSKAEANTSHLSPYIRYGCISAREVYRYVDERCSGRSAEMFKDRIVWQKHFNRKLEDNPDLFREAINPVYRDLHRDSRDENLIDAWKKGKTGYPLVDASMRALRETGWLNFRMRAMCASFYSYILKQWWREGADFFYKHLIDSDVAINYYQWQMQSGLVGVHANRIYDPVKQVEENDPDGKFIRRYVPELRPVPDRYIAEPWKMPESKQRELGVVIGKNYPEPVVDYDREAKKARSFFKKKAPEAYAAFRDDEVWKKASLSDRHSREEILEKAGKQSGLDSFTD